MVREQYRPRRRRPLAITNWLRSLFPSQQRIVFAMLAHTSERTANMPAANFVERVFKLKVFLVKGLNNNYRRRREGGDTASFLNAIHG